jgi:hypothetical protein
MCSCFGLSGEKKTIVVDDQEVVITVKGKNVTFRMSSSSDRERLDTVPESPKRRKATKSFESHSTNSSRSAFEGKRMSTEYEVPPYMGHTKSCNGSVGRTPHKDPFAAREA